MLAIIPARSGSKGLKDKNILSLDNKPLIAHTILTALNTEEISKVIVSTECENIAKISKIFGAEVPFLRPKYLAEDNSKAIDNYIFSIPKYEEFYNISFRDFCVLQPTSPLRISEDISKAIDLFYSNKADSVISFTEADHPPYWAKKIDRYLNVKSYFDYDSSKYNRQDLPKAYIPNGAIFVFNYNFLKNKETYYSENTFAYIMPKIRSIDIDTKLDFDFAEYILKNYENRLK